MDAGLGDFLRAGAAVYAAGYYHAAHDAWEERWLETDGEEADLLQGLIQLSAAVHHAQGGNWVGATGLAASGREYLAGGEALAEREGVNVDAVRDYLLALETDPESIERRSPVPLEVRGECVTLADLQFPATGIAARAIAEDRGDEVVEPAVDYAETDLDDEVVSSPFVTLVLDYLTAGGGGERGLILQRLEGHVGRRAQQESDVEGLF